MKQRLLLSLLMLFVSIGWIKGATVKVTPLGNTAVTVTLGSGQATVTEVEGYVTLSTDKKTVTIAQGYTTLVDITTPKTETSITFSGSMEALSINGGDNLKTISFGSNSYVKDLTVGGKAIAALDCSGLGLEKLTLGSSAELSALTKVDASDNKLKDGGITGLGDAPKLAELILSDNLYTKLDLSSLAALTSLNVANNQLESITLPTQLKSVNLSGNKLKTADIPDGCTEIWGTQVLAPQTRFTVTANAGVNVNDLLEAAGIETEAGASITNVSWQVKKGSEFVADGGATAHSHDYPNEYYFYNSTDGYVKGDYQCTFTYGKRTYAVSPIEVWQAEFKMKVETPANAEKIEVFVGTNTTAANNAEITVKQTDKIRVVVTPKKGYEGVTYTVKGLVPADATKKEPYTGKSFDFVVKAKYGEVPSLSAVVAAADRKVVYAEDQMTQVGGSFTVQKMSGNTTTGLTSGDPINTGDQLIITVKPNPGYTPSVTVGEKSFSDALVQTGESYTLKINITEDEYPAGEDIKVVVSFSNAVSVTAAINDKSITTAEAVAYLAYGKIAIIDGTTEKELSNTDGKGSVSLSSPNTTYTARFTLAEGYRLKDDMVIINGGKVNSITKNEVTVEGKNCMKYEVIFAVEQANVTLAITTVKMQPASVSFEHKVESGNLVQRQVYDGQAKALVFTTNPQNLKVTTTYNLNSLQGDVVETPVNAGTYIVSFELEDNSMYYFDKEYHARLVIEGAPLEIKTLPTVTVSEDGKSYNLTGGEVQFNEKAVTGTWKTNPTTPADPTKSHPVEVTFTPTSEADKVNFLETTAQVNVMVGDSPLDTYTVGTAEGGLPAGYSITYYNGNKELSETEQVAASTQITIVVTYPKGTKGVELKVTTAHLDQPDKDEAKSVDGRDVYTFKLSDASYKEALFSVSAGTGEKYNISFDKDLNNPYNGAPQAYDFTNSITVLDAEGKRVEWSAIKQVAKVSYSVGTTPVSGEPIDVATYDVTVTIPADAEKGYVETTVTGTGVFQITPVKAKVTTWPEASVIAKGMPLSYSDLTNGVVSIEGKFTWEDEDVVPPSAGEHKYNVVFTPTGAAAKNYTSVTSEEPIPVIVSDLQIVAFAQPAEAMIDVAKNGEAVQTGAPIINGDKLTVTITPKTDWEVTSITVNGQSHSFTQSGGKYVATVTVGDVSAAIDATFKAKSTEVIDPNSQYKVTVTESVRGAIISHPGENVVKRNEDFTFTVSTLAADADKVKVTASAGTLTKGTNGRWTLSNVQANTTITVSLSNPTALKVEVQKDYLNAKKYHIGTVEIIDGEATSYYYGDVITVMADPEAGVKFEKWSDGSKEEIHEITLTADTKVTAVFTGTPTGIEDIETAKVYTGKGFIQINNVANAEVTVVSISGRLQAKQEISGDTQIAVPQGIYVVVLQSGDDMKQLKVIVK